MATKWQKNKVDENSINNGYEYERKDRVTRDSLNAIVNNSLYAAQISENVAEQLSSLNPEDKIEFKGSNPNLLINGDFSINQRGKESYSGANIYCADRWLLTTQTAYFDTKTKFFKTTTQYGSIRQFVEFPERYAGKTLTLSCEVSDFVSVGDDLVLAFIDDAGTKSVKITGSGKFSVTGVVASNVTNLRCMIYKTETSGMECSCKIKYMKLEIGSIATTFTPRPYAEELALCKRYFLRLNFPSSGKNTYAGFNGGTSASRFFIPCNLRTSPTIFDYSAIDDFGINTSGSPVTATGMSVSSFVENGGVGLTLNASGLTAGDGSTLYISKNNAYLSFDAEM